MHIKFLLIISIFFCTLVFNLYSCIDYLVNSKNLENPKEKKSYYYLKKNRNYYFIKFKFITLIHTLAYTKSLLLGHHDSFPSELNYMMSSNMN